MALFAAHPFVSAIFVAYAWSKLSLYTDLFTIRKGSHCEIRSFQGRLVDDQAYSTV